MTATRMEALFDPLFAADASGRRWFAQLLAAAPHGPTALGDLVATPGGLELPLAMRGTNGRLGAFEYPAAAPRELLTWYIDHPEELVWPAGAQLSAPATTLRRALLYDDPPGARARAQERARELLPTRSAFSAEWWRFEEAGKLDLVFMTPWLVVALLDAGAGPLAPATGWYPPRTELHRTLEGARRLAGRRRWAAMLVSDEVIAPDAGDLERGTPHLSGDERQELRGAYLGNITWRALQAAVAE